MNRQTEIVFVNAEFQLKRDTKDNWKDENPILGEGEPALVIDNRGKVTHFKIGDGKTNWRELEAFSLSNQSDKPESDNNKMDKFGEVIKGAGAKTVTITDENGDTTDFRFVIPSYMTGWFSAGQLILQGQGGGLILRSGTGEIDCENSRLINIADPINANDAANKQYVDGLIGDISAVFDELHTYAQSLINGGAAE